MTTLFFLLKMYFLFVWMFCLHVCAWYLQVRRYRALWNWSLWSEVCGALASVQVPIEVRGVRFPLGLKLQRAVSCLVGVLGIEVRFSWRCIFLRLYFFKYLCVFVGVWGQPSGVIFFFSLLFWGVNSGCQQEVFYLLSHPRLGFQMKLLKHFSHLCK